MREQIIIRISLRDDVPSSWPSCEDYSAPSPLPSKQRVAGSNPAGRADQRFYLRGTARAGALLNRQPVAEVVRGGTGPGVLAAQTGMVFPRGDSYSARTADNFSAKAAGLNRWQVKAARPSRGVSQ
jgi:hypothetical protein